MEHSNPILMGNDSPQKFITIGEVMLRLTPPNYEKIRMASAFEASYGGSEANIALALANLGVDSTFFSVVPNNSLGKSAVRWLRCNDVHCTPMILSTKEETPSHRLGTYYLETGYGIRPSKVIYDRMHSALTEYDLTKVDLDELFDGFDWLHLSGITPALNKNCADFILRCLRAAKEKGLTVSFDGNFRSTLWSWEEARDYCTQCLPYVDVLFGIEPYHLWKDDEDHSKGDWKDGVPLQPSYEQQDEIFQHFIDRYPNLKCIARHALRPLRQREQPEGIHVVRGAHLRVQALHLQHSGPRRRRRRFCQRPDLRDDARLQADGHGQLCCGVQRHQAHHPRRRQHYRRRREHPQPDEHELRY